MNEHAESETRSYRDMDADNARLRIALQKIAAWQGVAEEDPLQALCDCVQFAVRALRGEST